jgi:PAS domain S-box-containing protein
MNLRRVIVAIADITERKQAEEALRESERRYRLLIENTATVAWITDQDGKTTFISPNVEQVYGYTPGEIVEAGEALWFGRIHSEDRERVKDDFESLFSKREQFDLEYRIQRKDGNWIWVYDRAGIVEERSGTPYAYGVFSDITERKQAEEALRKSEAKIRSVIEQSLDGIVLTDEQGVVIEWNRGEEEVTGIERKDALGKPVWDLQGRSIPGERGAVPSTREGLRSQTIEFLRTGEAPWANRLLENELQRPDGTCRVVQSVTFPIKTSQGFMAGTISRDITEQKQAERALRQSKDELTRAQQIAHMGNWNWDVQNNTLTWSEEVYRIFGVDRDFELTYEDIETMVHPDDREMNQEKVDELLSGTDSVEYEFRITRPDGTVRYIYQNAQISHDDAGGASRIFGIIHDITERKQAEQALAHQAEQLRLLSTRLSEAQEAERRRIAHELHDQVGQNLTVLGINLNTLRPHLAQAPEEVRACLNDSLGLVKQTTGRIRDVMADLRPPELDDYGLLSALRWYVDQIRLRTGLAVAVEGDSLHPRLSSQQETALFRIAQEALTNVVKHAQATQATVTLEASERQLRMIITDDGVGFDPASLAITNETPHWGVLTMKERAQAIGACWRVESNLGGGTRVVVEMARRLMAHPKGDQQ